MARNKKPLPLLEGVTIEAVAAEGKCLFHWDELVVFVPFCVPGDVCDIQIRRKKHSFAEGEVVRFIKYSNVRATPFCQHFGACGGCKWQNLPYEEQLKFKQKQVHDQLTRIGKVELPEFRPILGSVKTQEYRNKLDFGCANKRYLTKEEIATLPKANPQDTSLTSNPSPLTSLKDAPAIGFHITGAFDKILPIEKCWLMDDLHNRIRNEVRDYAVEHNLSFFDLRAQKGLLRDVIIRNSATGEWMVIFQFHYDETGGEKEAKALLQHIADKFQEISSLMYLDNQKCNDTIGDQDILVFKGNDHIFETMEDLKFKVGPKSFYQTNTEQAYHLYSVAREFAFSNLSPLTSRSALPLGSSKNPSPLNDVVLHIIGGGSLNKYLNQFTANATGVVVKAGPQEGTALGNIMMQAQSAGLVNDIWQMRQIIANSIDLVTYTPQDKELWDAAYEKYLKITQ